MAGLTPREKIVLEQKKHGLTDYQIARQLNLNPPNITRSRKNAHKKLLKAITDIQWAASQKIRICLYAETVAVQSAASYKYFL